MRPDRGAFAALCSCARTNGITIHVTPNLGGKMKVRASLALSVALLAACVSTPPASSGPPSFALTDSSDTKLERLFVAESSAHPGQSAFEVLPSGVHAFAARARLIDAAQQALDLQYYIVTRCWSRTTSRRWSVGAISPTNISALRPM
jgi:hypothetical protein